MKKGITPIISIIILLLITIALAGVAYTFLMGQLFTRVGGSFDIQVGGAFCVSNGTANEMTIMVVNTGTSTLATADFNLVQVDGRAVDASRGLQTISVPVEQSDILVSRHDCFNGASGCSSGYHTVDVATVSMVKHDSVHCP